MTSIGVIGCGVVGGAVYKGFKQKGFKVYGYDKHKPEFDDLPYIFQSDVIFVCVPTPTDFETGEQDLEPLREAFAFLRAHRYGGVIAVKSTVLPGTTERMGDLFGFSRVVHNPEFLTAARPFEDFLEQPAILIGGKDMGSVMEVADIYFTAAFGGKEPCPIRVYPSAKVTELAKYMRNNFLATKVSFFNEQAEICEKMSVEYELVLQAMLEIGHVDPTHTRVPGPDGKRGFGGMCFPKDSVAQFTHGKSLGLPMESLAGTIAGNLRRRGE